MSRKETEGLALQLKIPLGDVISLHIAARVKVIEDVPCDNGFMLFESVDDWVKWQSGSNKIIHVTFDLE